MFLDNQRKCEKQSLLFCIQMNTRLAIHPKPPVDKVFFSMDFILLNSPDHCRYFKRDQVIPRGCKIPHSISCAFHQDLGIDFIYQISYFTLIPLIFRIFLQHNSLCFLLNFFFKFSFFFFKLSPLFTQKFDQNWNYCEKPTLHFSYWYFDL